MVRKAYFGIVRRLTALYTCGAKGVYRGLSGFLVEMREEPDPNSTTSESAHRGSRKEPEVLSPGSCIRVQGSGRKPQILLKLLQKHGTVGFGV